MLGKSMEGWWWREMEGGLAVCGIQEVRKTVPLGRAPNPRTWCLRDTRTLGRTEGIDFEM